MKRVILNIRGTNGSGKSSIVRNLIHKDNNSEIINILPFGKITLLKNFKIAIIGTYETDCGGCDSLVKKEILKLIEYVVINYNSYDILFEGIIISTTYSTYSKLFKYLKLKFNFECKLLFLNIPPNICVERVYQRNNNTPIKEEGVYSKSKQIKKTIKKFYKEGYLVKVTDSSYSIEKLTNIVLNMFTKERKI